MSPLLTLARPGSRCFQRKPSLGNYNATRAQWIRAYRNARKLAKQGVSMSTKVSSVLWKAGLIVEFERNPLTDPLHGSALERLQQQRQVDLMISEILGEAVYGGTD